MRVETSPEDIHGMHASEGILTTRGGMTSHAAVVARGMGKPCVSGAGSLRVDYKTGTLLAEGTQLKKGDIITIDGSNGQVLKGEVAMLQPELSGDFAAIMEWADKIRRMKVRTNAETPADARMARSFGAEGIGLCRTEHMFFDERPHRGDARDDPGRHRKGTPHRSRQALADAALGFPRTVRDHGRACRSPSACSIRRCTNSCPRRKPRSLKSAAAMNVSAEKLRQRTEALHEFNPMLGHRGCRLAISYPEIAEMQARAIFEAAVEAAKKTGAPVVPEVMVPLVGLVEELDFVKARIDQVAKSVMQETGAKIDYLVGTMIELPRAAHPRRMSIAKMAEFFSFGTNDLTQTTFGISRDDAASFLETYRQKGIIEQDPFVYAGHRRRRRTGAHGVLSGAGRRGRRSNSASAANMAAIPPRSASAKRWGWTMCRARPTACRSPDWRPLRRRSRRGELRTTRQKWLLGEFGPIRSGILVIYQILLGYTQLAKWV